MKEFNSAHTAELLEGMRTYFDAGNTLSYAFRKAQLEAIIDAVERFESEIFEALWADLRKNKTEAYYSEIGLVLEEARNALANLKRWMEPEKPGSPLVVHPSVSTVYRQPKGVVLIISPWNYPFMLALMPLIGAIAAGNCAVIKPSEDAAHTAGLLEKLISSTFADNYIHVVNGAGADVVPPMIQGFDFNHIFFTGSPAVGSRLATMAAAKLISSTLELGGKSPGIIDAGANIPVAARRMAWGKFTNAGQTCVAPDYILVHEKVKDSFVGEAIKAIKSLYGEDAQKCPDYGRMINQKRFHTVAQYLDQGKRIYGGRTDEGDLYIEPSVIEPENMEVPVMHEEIFGPVWPVVTWSDRVDLLEMVRKNRYPLSLYYFGRDKALQRFITERIEFGGGCINNTLAHLGSPNLPFGGVQGSGWGSYHGKYSYDCFSNVKSVLHSSLWPDPPLRYPPYTASKLKWFRKLIG